MASATTDLEINGGASMSCGRVTQGASAGGREGGQGGREKVKGKREKVKGRRSRTVLPQDLTEVMLEVDDVVAHQERERCGRVGRKRLEADLVKVVARTRGSRSDAGASRMIEAT